MAVQTTATERTKKKNYISDCQVATDKMIFFFNVFCDGLETAASAVTVSRNGEIYRNGFNNRHYRFQWRSLYWWFLTVIVVNVCCNE